MVSHKRLFASCAYNRFRSLVDFCLAFRTFGFILASIALAFLGSSSTLLNIANEI